jgi:DNA repair protein RadC
MKTSLVTHLQPERCQPRAIRTLCGPSRHPVEWYTGAPRTLLRRSTLIAREAAPGYHLVIKDLPAAIRPRERLQALGPQSLSDEELVAIILRTGIPGANVLDVSRELLVRYDGLSGLNRASVAELARSAGVGPVKACDLKAAFEIGKRLLTLSPEEKPQITGPQDAYALLRGEMSLLEQESVRVVLLNTKNRVMNVSPLSLGTVNGSMVRVAEVFREAIRQQAAAIVLAHNHPSGDPTPSAEDVAITRKVVEAGELLSIEVLDHIVIGRPGPSTTGWVSLRERRLGFNS